MIRNLLATTALASFIATSAFAQDSANPSAPAATPAPSAGGATPDAAPAAAADAGEYIDRLEPGQYLASNLTGADIYESGAPDARAVGEIQNFVVNDDGKVQAIVIATSGLEQNKTIAAPTDKIELMNAENGEQRGVVKAGLDELQNAPAFLARSAEQAANNGAVAPGSGAAPAEVAPSVGTAPAGNTGMAANDAGGTAAQPMDSAAMGTSNGYLAALGNDQRLSEDLIGSNVYSGPGSDAETIGTVNDLVMTSAGDIPAAVVGVGGFLGVGEKNVGVPFARLQVQSNADGSNEPRLIMAANRDQLTAAPTFDDGEDEAQTASNATDERTSGSAVPGTGVGTAATGAGGTQMAQGTDATTAAQNSNEAATPMNADPATTASTGGANDRASMQPVSGPELTAENLDGVTVYGPNDQSIGAVGDVALTGEGQVDAIIVDVGGFLGIGAKPVAVAMDNLQFMRDTNGTVNVYTQFTEDQLRNAPEFNRETYAQNRSTMRLEPGNAPAPSGEAEGGANSSGGGSQPAQ